MSPHAPCAKETIMKTSTHLLLQTSLGLVLVGIAASAAGCGPVYVQERDDGYYSQSYPSSSYAQPAPVQPQQAVPAQSGPQTYFSDLGAYGSWINTPEYGQVWVPYANRTAGWRPYFYGSWVYTNWGWTWMSDEPWGAGPYHYGRWVWVNSQQWAWVPGYTWGPAWVVWGTSGSYVGWAPMGPDWQWGHHDHTHIHHSYWVYVSQNQMEGNKVQHVVIHSSDVPKVYNQTVVIQSQTQIRSHDGQTVVYSPGPSQEQARQWSGGRPVQPRSIDTVPNAQPRQIPAEAREPYQPPRQPATPGTRIPDGGVMTEPPQPARPGVEQPARPGVEQPARPGVEQPARPGVEQPARPSVEQPARPGVEQPARPGVEQPARPGVQQPVQPTQPVPPTRPGAGYEPVQPTQPVPPTRPGAGSEQPAQPTQPVPPTRPGAGYQPPEQPAPPASLPTRPGANYEKPDPQPAPSNRPGLGYQPPTQPAQPPATSRPSTPAPRPPAVDERVNRLPETPTGQSPGQNAPAPTPPPTSSNAKKKPAPTPAPAPAPAPARRPGGRPTAPVTEGQRR
jgi:hypothetical protein